MAPTNGSRVPTSPCTTDILSSYSKLVSSDNMFKIGNILQNIVIMFSFIMNIINVFSAAGGPKLSADLVYCLTSSFVIRDL